MNPVEYILRFSDALTEVGEAGIYGGMHYRNSTRIGANMGRRVSRFTTRHLLPSVEQRRRQTEPIVK
jgi:hypothetical protein